MSFPNKANVRSAARRARQFVHLAYIDQNHASFAMAVSIANTLSAYG